MRIIQETSDNKFTLDGIEYQKNFQAVRVGNSNQIRIIGVYDSRLSILNATKAEDVEVNGVVYNDVEVLIKALTSVLFSKFTLDDVAEDFQQSINNRISNFEDTVENQVNQNNQKVDGLEIEVDDIRQNVQNIGTGVGGKMYATLQDAIDEPNKPDDGTIFQVSEVTDPSNAGVYSWQSSEPDGYKFEYKNRKGISVNTIANLRNYRGDQDEAINVLGYYSQGDGGGGGEFYWDNTSEEDDNGGTIFKVTGVEIGRWKRRISGPINVKWFGAKGDGVADDTGSMQNAIVSARNGELFIPSGIFRTTEPLTVRERDFTVIYGSGIDSTKIICEDRFLYTTSNTVTSTSLSKDIAAGDSQITVTNASGIEEGHLMTIYSSELMPENAFQVNRSHAAIVTAVDGNTITLDRDTYISFDSTEDVQVRASVVGSLDLRSMSIHGQVTGYFIDISRLNSPKIQNINIVNSLKTYQGVIPGGGVGMSAFRLQFVLDSYFSNIRFDHIHYGVMPSLGTSSCTVENSTAIRCRHIVAPTGGSSDFTGINLKSYKCFAGLDSHQGAFKSNFFNCSDFGNEVTAKFRGRFDVIENCYIEGGIELRNDGGIPENEYQNINKILRGVIVRGDIFGVAPKMKIQNSNVFGQVTNYSTTGVSTIIEDSVINFSPENINELDSPYALWVTRMDEYILRGVKINGPREGGQEGQVKNAPALSGIYVETYTEKNAVFESVTIQGFDNGIRMRFNANLSAWTFSNILIKNCVEAIDFAGTFKDFLTINGLTFEGNNVNISEPQRIRYPNVSSKPSDILPRLVYRGSPPATGVWRKSDIIVNDNINLSGPLGWVCVSEGTFGETNPIFTPFGSPSGTSGTFTDPDGKTVTVENGIITQITEP